MGSNIALMTKTGVCPACILFSSPRVELLRYEIRDFLGLVVTVSQNEHVHVTIRHTQRGPSAA